MSTGLPGFPTANPAAPAPAVPPPPLGLKLRVGRSGADLIGAERIDNGATCSLGFDRLLRLLVFVFDEAPMFSGAGTFLRFILLFFKLESLVISESSSAYTGDFVVVVADVGVVAFSLFSSCESGV